MHILHFTDLFTDGDFDDYFDLAGIYALDRLESAAIVLDGDGDQQTGPRGGSAALRRFQRLIGRRDPFFIGLNRPLRSPDDPGSDSPPELQRNVEKILDWLETVPGPVTVTVVSSLRTLAAAYNRNPALLQDKIERVLVVAGDAAVSYQEWNVALDASAYRRILSSPLPVWQVPCFECGLWSSGPHSAYFTARHSELFERTDDALFRWYIYRFYQQTGPYETYRWTPAEQADFLAATRNLWSVPFFTILDGSYPDLLQQFDRSTGRSLNDIFTFEPGPVRYRAGERIVTVPDRLIPQLRLPEPDSYPSFGKFIIRHNFARIRRKINAQEEFFTSQDGLPPAE